ncbi:hypothetical protein EI555_015022 [Monodon monoceros]|uniref:DH domain-containing protein n=1 Tax=Monodon monoceros TaxID=40151 RepID=A0A4V5P6V3_MONMO|nr:hypothetical protein EI555_015022 [Monodon monoceros]
MCTKMIHLLKGKRSDLGYKIGIKNLLRPEVRDFWEKLGSYVAPGEEGGHVDLFVQLGASEAGTEVLSQLSQLTGTLLTAPPLVLPPARTNTCERAPPSTYFSESKLQTWSSLTDFLEDTLKSVRQQLSPLFKELQKNVSGRMTGQFVSDTMSMANILNNQEIIQALAKGLIELSKENSGLPQITKSAFNPQERNVIEENPQDTKSSLSKNGPNFELLLELVVTSQYFMATLSSYCRWFLDDLRDRLQEWGPAHCVGEIFIKFGSQLNIYANFFNNYPVILKTMEKCREMIPALRAFLKRHDKTIVTKMLSLPELLLHPSRRSEENIHLLYALRLHTSAEHLKQNINMKDQLSDIERIICGCPTLSEVNRYLIRVQDVAQLHCCDEELIFSLRLYEHTCDLSLFLFNDALLVSSGGTSRTPFERTSKSTYQFIASVALHRLLIEDIPDSKCMYSFPPKRLSDFCRSDCTSSSISRNAFILQGPKHEWICATEVEDDKFLWLSVLQNAIESSMEK